MKKYIVGGMLGVVTLAVVIGIGAFAMNRVDAKQEQKRNEAQYTMIQNQAEEEGKDLIKQEEAKAIAFEKAGITEGEVKELEVQLEYGLDDDDDEQEQLAINHPYVYEVEFQHEGLEYEFKIDAQTKEIVESEIDTRD